jgi:ElaB/YqjD/DUF883 family membrane-anchored ribosome-binding protein
MIESNTLAGGNSVSSIADKAHRAVDEASIKATPVIERGAAAAHRTIDTVADTAMAVAGSRGVIEARSTEFANACSGYIRERPFATIASALAVGYLAGRLVR